MKKIIFIITFLTILIAPAAANAQLGAATGKLQAVAGGTGLESDFKITVSSVITTALSLVGTIFLALTVYAGILWMTASGNEDQVTKAKTIVTQTVIGLAITLGAYAITAFVTAKLNPSGLGSLSSDDCAKSAVAKGLKAVGGGCQAAACVSPQQDLGDCSYADLPHCCAAP